MRSEPLETSADLVLVRDQENPAEPTPIEATATETAAIEAVAADTATVGMAARDAAPNAAATLRRPRPTGRLFVGEIPLALVICGVGVGLVVIALHHFRWGNVAISASVLAGGVFRLILPARKAGLLVVRTRLTDVVTMGVIGGALMVLALVTRT